MSDYTDYMEWCFFSHATEIREQVLNTERWIEDYLSKRKDYPTWKTRDGQELKVEDITDSHLENLLNFVHKGNPWHRVFECEKVYRQLVKKLPELKAEMKENDYVIETCF